jgi:hypothetical protein
MSEFFRDGGVAMVPVLLLGSLAVAAAVLTVLQPERRRGALTLALSVTCLASGLLGFCFGLIGIFRYVQHVLPDHQIAMVTLGISQSLHPVALALVLDVVAGLLAAAGALRASPLPARAVSAP